jgi:diaminopimelate epimerase
MLMAVKMIKVHGFWETIFYLLDQTQFQAPLSDADLKQLAINVCKRGRRRFYMMVPMGVLVVDKSETFAKSLVACGSLTQTAPRLACVGNGLRDGGTLLGKPKNSVEDFSGSRPCMRTLKVQGRC